MTGRGMLSRHRTTMVPANMRCLGIMAAGPRVVVGGRGNLDDVVGVGEGLGGLPGPFFVQGFGSEFG